MKKASILFNGNGFGKISGLVYITSFIDSNVIGQQLEWHRSENGRKALRNSRHLDAVVCYVPDCMVPCGNDGDYLASAGFDFLDVADGFFVNAI